MGHRTDGLHFRAQLPSPFPRHPSLPLHKPRKLSPTHKPSHQHWVPDISSGKLLGPDCRIVCPSLQPSKLSSFCKLRGNCASSPASPLPPPVFACTSFSPLLSSPEEDLPWQSPEEKEGEGCRNKSCHSTGTLEPFLSLTAKVRGGIPAGTPKVQCLPPTRAAHSEQRG